jgi:homoserine dehydrogenase
LPTRSCSDRCAYDTRYVARLTRSTIIHDRQKGTLLDHQKPKESGAVAIGVHEVDPNSQLGALTGSDNVVLVESNLFKNGQELMLHGPGVWRSQPQYLCNTASYSLIQCAGGGLDRTVAAVKADLYLCAMEMPRHHVIGAGHLF